MLRAKIHLKQQEPEKAWEEWDSAVSRAEAAQGVATPDVLANLYQVRGQEKFDETWDFQESNKTSLTDEVRLKLVAGYDAAGGEFGKAARTANSRLQLVQAYGWAAMALATGSILASDSPTIGPGQAEQKYYKKVVGYLRRADEVWTRHRPKDFNWYFTVAKMFSKNADAILHEQIHGTLMTQSDAKQAVQWANYMAELNPSRAQTWIDQANQLDELVKALVRNNAIQ